MGLREETKFYQRLRATFPAGLPGEIPERDSGLACLQRSRYTSPVPALRWSPPPATTRKGNCRAFRWRCDTAPNSDRCYHPIMRPTMRSVLCLLALVAVAYGQVSPAAPTAALSAPKLPTLTNADIIALKQAGFSDDLMILEITALGASYELGAKDLMELKKAGISESVMASMIESSTDASAAHGHPSAPCDPGSKETQSGDCKPKTAAAMQSVADQIKAGQTITDVHALLGKPNRPGYRPQWEEWNISPDSKRVLEVQYDKEGVVLWVHNFVDQSNGNTPKDIQDRQEWANRDRGASAQSETTVADKVAGAAAGVYYSWACPTVFRKSVWLMTANDAQLIRQCNANGFMLFGIYVYTGVRQ